MSIFELSPERIAPEPRRNGSDRKSRRRPRYLTRADKIPELTAAARAQARKVAEKYVFRSNDYYNGLIDWSDPNDPIRRIIMPDVAELDEWGKLDASDEESYTAVPGLEHKYRDTALLLVNDVCGAYCRFCFRKRLFMNDNDEVVRDVTQGVAYIRAHPEINNVLLTGGDPLILSTQKLEPILARLREIPHVEIIRIGSKMPAFNPFRFLDDPSLMACFRRHSTPHKKIYVMCHFNHPRELTDEAIEGLAVLQRAGVTTVNQSPMIKGVNDDPEVLSTLFDKLSYIGVPPYYVFQGRPTEGNKPFTLPVETAYRVFAEARLRASGLAKRARFAMSHRTGKVEVLGIVGSKTIFHYHRAADPAHEGRILICDSNPQAMWFDDYDLPEDSPVVDRLG